MKKGTPRADDMVRARNGEANFDILLFSIIFYYVSGARRYFSGNTFGQSYREPNYKIEFHSEDSPFCPDDDQESVIMPNKNGHNFLCYLPKVEKAKSGNPVSVSQHNASSMIVETQKQVKMKTPDELLEVLKDRCFITVGGHMNFATKTSYGNCIWKMIGWFRNLSWECMMQRPQLLTTKISSTLKDPRSKDASQRYHAHQYKNGTHCDLTNQHRETEVRFVCSEPRAMISSITELFTCKYALTIQCRMLCKHPLYQEERPVWHTINCNVLPKDYMETKVEEDKVEPNKILMVTGDKENPSNYQTEE